MSGAAVDYTMLVCTYNRAGDLAELLETALRQRTGGRFTYEVLVVDNNSTDGTRALVQRFIAAAPEVIRYLFEPRQGKSNALNTGLEAMRGRRYAIVDDDFVLPPDWLLRIDAGFGRHPAAAFVGGKVLPRWESPPPEWLTPAHWSALALADYGDAELRVDAHRELCLLACTFDAESVRAVGGYDSRLAVSGDRIGGVEDIELLQRLWAAGCYGVYLPEVRFEHKVQSHRTTRAYHRRWHRGHGASYAMMRDPAMEQSRARLFDVPVHLYRDAVRSLFAAPLLRLKGDVPGAFAAMTRVAFAAGFIEARRSEYGATGRRGIFREAVSALSALLRSRPGSSAPLA
ncbi:MAG: glycosyltransferase family 2 protein [Gemmatimonadaceae bacterium]|nr:glycosyltransferase family 2 protein [Gemmatimonadaceae bacterium]NUP70748.1 glycosyltransferase family 2 protein [Gemmatimonadaceae bacterium]NUR33096.1 glycosyltransferase family 2 protein [Gemmatimonadaceae bacterium]NUS32046.1 glycosyltransferase family 2 protein [Gemmatimonadaceae bacterium]NUS48844.1 glycosyltransferase family 2 protein [Gemmatimonadaceae bacterium]